VQDIRVPQLNSNDTQYLLVEWLAADGCDVDSSTPVAVVETSKAAEELSAGARGVLHRLLASGRHCRAGEVIGRVFPSEQARLDSLADPAGTGPDPAGPDGAGSPGARPPADDPPAAAGPVITEPARLLAAELGVDLTDLRALGRPVVRVADVRELAVHAAGSDPLPLPRTQPAVAEVVSRSHATIPAAFVVIRVNVEEALDVAREATRRHGVLIGLPELLVTALGRLAVGHPRLFGRPAGAQRLDRADGAHVAVTIDVGQGLFTPVVRDCDSRRLADIAGTVMTHRLTALRGEFRAQDLRDGRILVSLSTDDDVLMNHPIVPPDMVGALSLGGVHPHPVPAAATGQVRFVPTVLLGLSHDHRFVDGSAASAFLKGVKALLEGPRRLDD
jgi:2-oxoglutarate dehydrogenase E2 component (dihydrolipoamide succinyltransferase)